MDSNRLMHQLYQTTRAISQGINYCLADYGLYSSEWSILMSLKELGPTSQISLANYLNVEPAAISKSVIKLEEKQLIERKPGNDRREKNVFLTDRALAQYNQWEEAIQKHRQEVLADLPEEKQNQLFAMLQSMYSNSQKYQS